MKKLLLMFTLGATFIGFSQDMYFTPYVGYGIGLPGETALETVSDTGQTNFSTKNAGLGRGLNAGVSFGIILEDGVGVDFALSFQNNLGQTFEDQGYAFDFNPITGELITVPTTTTRTLNTWSIRFTPSIRFEMEGADIKPFAQVGPSLMYSGFTTTYKTEASGSTTEREEKYAANLTIGASATAGVEFELADNLLLVTALQFNMGFTSPKKAEVTKATFNGEDMLPDMEVAEKEVEFEKEGELYGNDPDKPLVMPRERLDYSSVGLIVGVKILLD